MVSRVKNGTVKGGRADLDRVGLRARDSDRLDAIVPVREVDPGSRLRSAATTEQCVEVARGAGDGGERRRERFVLRAAALAAHRPHYWRRLTRSGRHSASGSLGAWAPVGRIYLTRHVLFLGRRVKMPAVISSCAGECRGLPGLIARGCLSRPCSRRSGDQSLSVPLNRCRAQACWATREDRPRSAGMEEGCLGSSSAGFDVVAATSVASPRKARDPCRRWRCDCPEARRRSDVPPGPAGLEFQARWGP
jgi:hypothetical protein